MVAHCDWCTGNLRWDGDELHVVHDWDSTIVDTEAAVVGFAAGVYPAVHAGSEATVEESQAFTRRQAFDRDEMECCWAAGVWLRAYEPRSRPPTDSPSGPSPPPKPTNGSDVPASADPLNESGAWIGARRADAGPP